MHYFGTLDERAFAAAPVFEGRSRGYAEAALVNDSTGSVHTGLSMNQLTPGGSIPPHVHSFEEGFYVLSGAPALTIDGHGYALKPGDFGAIKIGTPHAWRNASTDAARWLQMAAPQPKPAGKERDTFFLRGQSIPDGARPIDVNDLHGHLLGHFDVGQIPATEEGRITGGGLKGVFLRWMIDEKLGARHHRMLFIEYQPGVSIGLHDHTFEEAYFILSGEVEATLDGRRYRAKAGDVLWTGVGCVHAFANVSAEPVRWLETFSPQPPAENVFRFIAEWEQRARELEG